METTKAIAKIEVKELDEVVNKAGLEIAQGEAIKQAYLPFLNQLADIQGRAIELNFDSPAEKDEKLARELRLLTVKIRTGSEELKEKRKKIHLLKGNLEQASYNLISASCKLAEESFVQVEKAREIAEKNRRDQLQTERVAQLTGLCDNPKMYQLGTMSEVAFNQLLEGFKSAKKIKEQEEKEAIEKELLAKKEKEKKDFRMGEMLKLKLIWDGEQFSYKDVNFHWTDLICMEDDVFSKTVVGATERLKTIREEEAKEAEKTELLSKQNENLQKANQELENKVEVVQKESEVP